MRFKYFLLSKYIIVTFSLFSLKGFAGQGVYIQINDFTNSNLTFKIDSICTSGVNTISLNKTAYVEANQSGSCFFQKSDVHLKLFENATLIASYYLNISALGSTFVVDFKELNISLRVENTFYPHSGLNGSQDFIVISASNSVDNWQEEMSPYIANRSLNKVPIPGTHDSGTYTISNDSFVTPDASSFLNIIGNSSFVSTMVGWAKTQNFNIHEQLTRGIRYFDLRLCGLSYDGESIPLVSCHMLSGASIEEIFNQTAKFLNDSKHSQEIVFLDINHIYQVDNNQIDKLRNLAYFYFGNKLASPLEFSPQSTYQDLWNTGKQVLLFWNVAQEDFFFVPENDPLFWNASTIESIWPDKQNVSDLKSSLKEIIAHNNSNSFSVLQTLLTPTAENIVNGIFKNSDPKSLLHFSKYKLEINSFLRSENIFNQMKEKGNIIIEDFSNGVDLVSYCKDLIKQY